MQNNIVIEQFSFADRSDLLAFLKTAYDDNPRQYDEDFWKWHYLKTPHSHLKNMPIWLAKSNNQIVGQLAAIPVEVNIGNEQSKGLWIVDFIVSEKFRRQGIGKMLVLAAQKSYPVTMALGTDEQHTPVLLESIGWKIVGEIPRYHKLLFPGAAIKEISKIRSLAKILDFSFMPFRPRSDPKYFEDNNNLRFVNKFDADFNKLWEEASIQWDCAVKRNSKMLEWQYKLQPNKEFDILGYYEDDKLLGYAVLFFRKRNFYRVLSKGAISDIVYHPSNPSKIVGELLQGAIQLAIKKRAGGLVTDVLDSLVEEKLKNLGFWRVKNPLRLMIKSDVHQKSVYNLNSWFLTRGDSDISIFEEPNI